MILDWFPPKEFYELPVTVEKKSWRFPYFCKSYCQKKNRDIFVGYPVYFDYCMYAIHPKCRGRRSQTPIFGKTPPFQWISIGEWFKLPWIWYLNKTQTLLQRTTLNELGNTSFANRNMYIVIKINPHYKM